MLTKQLEARVQRILTAAGKKCIEKKEEWKELAPNKVHVLSRAYGV
jgi:hypothetical protein